MKDDVQGRNYGTRDEEIANKKKWEYEEDMSEFNTRPKKFKTNHEIMELVKK